MVNVGGQGGVAGVFTSLLVVGTQYWKTEDPPVTVELADGVFLNEVDEEPCNFLNGTTVYKNALCSHFSLARLPTHTTDEALRRALDCATEYAVDCILSPEIGLNVPAAYVYDAQLGLRAVIAPTLSWKSADVATVQLALPDTGERMRTATYHRSVAAQFLDGSTRAVLAMNFSGTAAFCVQQLRDTFANECWNSID